MASSQSPEGVSSMMFPLIMGKRKTSELLLADKVMNAEEALECGWVNGIVELEKEEFFDYKKIPCIPKLLENDL